MMILDDFLPPISARRAATKGRYVNQGVLPSDWSAVSAARRSFGQKIEHVDVPRRRALVRIGWQDNRGRRVPMDEPLCTPCLEGTIVNACGSTTAIEVIEDCGYANWKLAGRPR